MHYVQCGVTHPLGHLSRVYLYLCQASVTCTSYTYFPLPHSQRERESGLTNISLLLCAFTVCYSTVDTSSEDIAMAESSKLSLQHVTTALYPLSIEQMKELVVYFGVELRVISDIETTHKENIKMYSIQAWLDQDTEASWEKIVSGLEQIGMNVLARQVATQHCPQSLVPATPSSDPHQPATVPTSQPTNTPAPPGTSSVATSQQPASDHTPQPETTLHPPQPTNTPAPATPSPVATTPPVTDCDQSPNQPPHTTSSTPATVPDQSNPPANEHYSQALALPPPSTSPATDSLNQPSSITTVSSTPATITLALSSATHQPSFWSVGKVKATILQLEETFANLQADAEVEIGEQEAGDGRFLARFRSRLLLLPVSKKAIHVKFFEKNEDAILEAKNTRKVLAILCRYMNYRNYEILLHIITRFCTVPLQDSMQKYRVSLEAFEMHTTVDVYISAAPDEMNKKLERGLSQMVLKIEKPASQCTLHEVRKLNETITAEAGLESHSVYISGVAENCVLVKVSFPHSAVGWVLSAMTPNFMTTHCLSEVTLDGRQLTLELGETDELVCDIKSCVMYNNIHLSTCTVYTMWSILSSKQPHRIHAYVYKHL